MVMRPRCDYESSFADIWTVTKCIRMLHIITSYLLLVSHRICMMAPLCASFVYWKYFVILIKLVMLEYKRIRQARFRLSQMLS